MRTFLIASAFLLTSLSAHAVCTTNGPMTTCSDGTTYNQLGNTTYGSNSRTGSNWSQTGKGSLTFGWSYDGGTWSGVTSSGIDSKGNSWTCVENVCK